ncbi:MAG: hypothetical protein ACOCQD_01065 [archaeon]
MNNKISLSIDQLTSKLIKHKNLNNIRFPSEIKFLSELKKQFYIVDIYLSNLTFLNEIQNTQSNFTIFSYNNSICLVKYNDGKFLLYLFIYNLSDLKDILSSELFKRKYLSDYQISLLDMVLYQLDKQIQTPSKKNLIVDNDFTLFDNGIKINKEITLKYLFYKNRFIQIPYKFSREKIYDICIYLDNKNRIISLTHKGEHPNSYRGYYCLGYYKGKKASKKLLDKILSSLEIAVVGDVYSLKEDYYQLILNSEIKES